jgi:hypothetical protein
VCSLAASAACFSIAEGVPVLAVARRMLTGPESDRQPVEAANIIIPTTALRPTARSTWHNFPIQTSHAAGGAPDGRSRISRRRRIVVAVWGFLSL